MFIHLSVKFDFFGSFVWTLFVADFQWIKSVHFHPCVILPPSPLEVKILRTSNFFCVYLVVQSYFFPLLEVLSTACKDSMKHISVTLGLVYEYKGCTVFAVLILSQAASSGFIRILLQNKKWSYKDIFRVQHLP